MHAQNAARTELVPVFTGVRVVLAWKLGQSESKRHIQSVTLDYGYLVALKFLRDKSQRVSGGAWWPRSVTWGWGPKRRPGLWQGKPSDLSLHMLIPQ